MRKEKERKKNNWEEGGRKGSWENEVHQGAPGHHPEGCTWPGRVTGPCPQTTGTWSLALLGPGGPGLPFPTSLCSLASRLHPGPHAAVSLARPAWILVNDQGRDQGLESHASESSAGAPWRPGSRTYLSTYPPVLPRFPDQPSGDGEVERMN